MFRTILAAGLMLVATPAAAKCLAYGKQVQMIGQVFAFEAFDETEADTVRRLREVDYYAMLLPEKTCFGKGKAALQNQTMVGLRGDAKALALFARTPVQVTGKLSRGPAEADPAVVLTVTSVQPLKVE